MARFVILPVQPERVINLEQLVIAERTKEENAVKVTLHFDATAVRSVPLGSVEPGPQSHPLTFSVRGKIAESLWKKITEAAERLE